MSRAACCCHDLSRLVTRAGSVPHGFRLSHLTTSLEEPFRRIALEALGSRSEGPFDLLHVLAREPLIT